MILNSKNNESNKIDCCFLIPNNAKKSYQKLSETYSAIEPPTWALLLSQSVRSVGFKPFIIDANAENLDNEQILKSKNIKLRDKFEKVLLKNYIEFRRGNAGGGNQLRQPYLKKFVKNINLKNFKEVDHIHFFGYYIGNYPSLKFSKIKKICKILNEIKL